MTKDSVETTVSEQTFNNNIFLHITSSSKNYKPDECVQDFKKLTHQSQIYLILRLFCTYDYDKYKSYPQILAPLSCQLFYDTLSKLLDFASNKNIVENFCSTMVQKNCQCCQVLQNIAKELWTQENLISDDQVLQKNFSDVKFLNFYGYHLEFNENPKFPPRFKREVLRYLFTQLKHITNKLPPDTIDLPLEKNEMYSIASFGAYKNIRFDNLKAADYPRPGTCGLTSISNLLKEIRLFEEPDDDEWLSINAIADAKEKCRSAVKQAMQKNSEMLEKHFRNYITKLYSFRKTKQTQEICGLCCKSFKKIGSLSKKYFIIHKEMETGQCSEVYHLDCLLRWITFHNAFLVHWNGHNSLTRYIRTFHVTYPCPNCKNEGHLITEPTKSWNINNWSRRKDQEEDDFTFDAELDNQPVYGISDGTIDAMEKK